MPTRDKTTPKGKEFHKQIEELTKLQVRAGYQHGVAIDEETGADMVDVAMWNELGTEHSPARPFLRQSVDKNEGRIKNMCAAQLRAIARGEKTAQGALEALGAMQKGLIQGEIRDGGFEPNAPSTIWKKSEKALRVVKGDDGKKVKRKSGKAVKRLVVTKVSDTPLIDTGRMRQSVNFAIQPKKGG